MKRRKVIGLLLIASMMASMTVGCGNESKSSSDSGNDKAAETQSDTNTETKSDKITAILPPVTSAYQENIDDYISTYEEENPGIEIEVVSASWEDFSEKLDVQVNAGSPPDIAFIGSGDISKYIETGMLLDISDYASEEMLGDFDESVLEYMKNGDSVYGFPAYCSVQAIGGNKALLEAAGIDWKNIQQNGWTIDEFREACKKGTIVENGEVKQYGFVSACSGVSVEDYFNIFAKNAGMPAPFDEDGKYAYTSENMLQLLQSYRDLIEDGSAPESMSTIDGTKKNNMFLTGQAMMICKGTPTLEKTAYDNTKLLESGDSSAVEGSIPVECVFLPAPTFDGQTQNAQGTIDGYVCFSADASNEEHINNVIDFAYYLASGETAAEVCKDLYVTPVCESGREAYDKLPVIEGKSEDNTNAIGLLQEQVAPARPDISSELMSQATQLADEVIFPKLSSLLSGETTPEDMYNAICEAAYETFGEENCA